MHNDAMVSMLDLLQKRRRVRIRGAVVVAGLSLIIAGYSGVAVAADEHQMDMPMDHGSMDHSSMDHGSMDHSSMDHGSMDHSSMDHSGMDHSMDQGGHEQHMAMMKQAGKFTRSVETYDVPGVRMLDMNGKEVSLQRELSGDKPVFMNFIFTTCTTICPVMSASFQQVQELLGGERSNVRMVSVSIDPEHDTPAKLKEYAGKYSADSQWTLLTGTVEDSIAVQKAYNIYSGDKMNHQPVTFLKAKGSQNTWVRLDGLVDAGDIVKEYRKLEAN